MNHVIPLLQQSMVHSALAGGTLKTLKMSHQPSRQLSKELHEDMNIKSMPGMKTIATFSNGYLLLLLSY